MQAVFLFAKIGGSMRFNLNNILVPEAHLLGLALGLLLHLFLKIRILPLAEIRHLIGWTLIVLGAGLSLWAAAEAGEMEISSAERLITSGPYAYSRNPMYVGWSFLYLGISFVVNSFWLLALFPLVVIYIHFVEIPKEEQLLEPQFGSQYKEYRNRVRKYL
jgi:protein-S-isoprenylcysteine O-methyltransferase Ste14